jgi:hypothetical protein
MGFIKNIFNKNNTISNTIDSAGSFAENVRAAITGNIKPDKLAEIIIQSQELSKQANNASKEMNLAEAQSDKLFVAGWRPFIGWVCGVSLAVFFIPQFLLGTLLWAKECLLLGIIRSYSIKVDGLMELVLGMLGIAGLRTAEKFGGVHKKH